MTTNFSPRHRRIALFRRAGLYAVAMLLTFCMSVFVSTPWTKVELVIVFAGALVAGKRLFTAEVWPLLALIAYDLAVTLVFPGPRPDLWTVLQRPLFYTLCVLLCSICLHYKDIRACYLVMFGILAISLFGAVGDLTGHDMLSLLPFEMPNENTFDQVAVTSSGLARIRGFFPESGVLGAASMAVATCLGLGAVAFLLRRIRRGVAVFALFGSAFIGLAILGITITKSGIAMVAASLIGFLSVLLFSRNNKYRRGAVAIVAATVIIGGVAVSVPSDVSSYLRGEIGAVVHMGDMNPLMLKAQNGMLTRIECWKLAIYAVRYYPLGVGVWGHGSVLEHDTPVRPTDEMLYFFQDDIFGLKNAMANIMAETGLVGIGLLLFWWWRGFIRPARRLLREGAPGNVLVAALYVGSAFCSLAFLVSCEMYPCLSMLLLLKLHADAVAWEVEKANEALYLEEAAESESGDGYLLGGMPGFNSNPAT